ncbi:MAG: HTTM domain-containing protein [Planctomycetota bacterium]
MAIDPVIFRGSSPTRLGMFRAAFFGLAFVFYVVLGIGSHSAHIAEFADTPASWWAPMVLFEALGITPPFSPALLHGVFIAWALALFAAAVGLMTRTSCAMAFLLGLFVLGMPLNFGKLNHSDTIPLIAMLVFAFGRSGDGFSVDALLRKRPTDVAGEYGWPIQFIRVVGCMAFFLAGFAKLYHGGLDWITTDRLAYLLVSHHYSHAPLVSWALPFTEHAWLMRPMAAGVIVLELCVPLALINRRLALILIPAMAASQLGFGLCMGVWFWPYALYYLAWLPWQQPTAPAPITAQTVAPTPDTAAVLAA